MKVQLFQENGAALIWLPGLVLFFAFLFQPCLPDGACLAAQSKPEKVRIDRHPKPEGWTPEDQARAAERGARTEDFILEVKEEPLTLRKHRLCRLGLGPDDTGQDYLLLNSPYVNTYDDTFEPVRFMHTHHAVNLSNNCADCHHYRPADPEAEEIVRCAACHQNPYTQPDPKRVGLKAAYHLQCLTCHRKQEQGPLECIGCHRRNPADHTDLVSLPAEPDYREVTSNCLSCHQDEGAEMLKSAHWRWRGPSSNIVGHEKEVCLGKGGKAINNF